MINQPYICYQRIVPPALEAAGTKFWPPGATLTVAFLEGHPVVKEKIIEYANQWLQFANIKFDFLLHPDPEAHIRISFNSKNGSWSAVGKDALNEIYFPSGEPTMNYGGLTPESPLEVYSVVLHEFGHALGLVHEHSSPSSKIRWNRKNVVSDLSGPPNCWDIGMIEHNVFAKYTDTMTQFTKFDPKSIMLYSFPPTWTLDGMQFKINRVLSRTDKEFIQEQYPH